MIGSRNKTYAEQKNELTRLIEGTLKERPEIYRPDLNYQALIMYGFGKLTVKRILETLEEAGLCEVTDDKVLSKIWRKPKTAQT